MWSQAPRSLLAEQLEPIAAARATARTAAIARALAGVLEHGYYALEDLELVSLHPLYGVGCYIRSKQEWGTASNVVTRG